MVVLQNKHNSPGYSNTILASDILLSKDTQYRSRPRVSQVTTDVEQQRYTIIIRKIIRFDVLI